MSAAPLKPQIIVDRGIEPTADFVFASSDTMGNPGRLFTFVVQATGHSPEAVSAETLSPGFAIVEEASLPVLVVVVTVDPADTSATERLLRLNLGRALTAIMANSAGHTLWIPLMGTGAGGLSASSSFRAIVETLLSSKLLQKGAPSAIAISASPDLPVEELDGMQRYAAEVLGERVAGLDPADDVTTTEALAEAAEDVLVDVAKEALTKDAESEEKPERVSARKRRPRRRIITEVQNLLAEQGYDPGFADGLVGPVTSAAIRVFQADQGLEETGEYDRELLDALRAAAAARRTTPPGLPDATAPFYPDHPALEDALGGEREAIAEAIATIVADARRQEQRQVAQRQRANASVGEPDQTFMVHIHGRWGSGKTSILNFLRKLLSSGATGEQWVVVDYNAWRNQGHGPAWWTLLNRVQAVAVERLGGWRTGPGRRLIWSDIFWRLRSGWVPYGIVVAMGIALVFLLSALGVFKFDNALKVVGSMVAIAAGVFAFGRTYRIGSARTAATMLELSRDPLRPLTRRYKRMIDQIGRPVAVFIDDLDRCDAAFVVELLQSIQTLYRRARVLYVVAADRDWVCCSYEQIYDPFQEPISEPGRPLGHLFLEKIFQLSITVPNLSPQSRRDFWSQLVDGKLPGSAEESAQMVAEEKAKIDELQTEAEIRTYTEKIRNDPVRRRIAGAQAFRRLQSEPLRAEREHFLMAYANLVEPNPRAMKRLVNAYGFKRGFELMASQSSPADALVRWTILELRWPALAAALARQPVKVEAAGKPVADEATETDRLLAEAEVRAVTEGLTPALIRLVVGNVDAEVGREPTAA